MATLGVAPRDDDLPILRAPRFIDSRRARGENSGLINDGDVDGRVVQASSSREVGNEDG